MELGTKEAIGGDCALCIIGLSQQQILLQPVQSTTFSFPL